MLYLLCANLSNYAMLEQNLKKSFNLTTFRTGQREIISAVLNKQDALAVLPTGGGKSLCYQFPAVHTNQLVIVISPLIALMKDQVYALNQKGIPAGCLYSKQTEDEKRLIFQTIQLGGAYILYLSPERVQKDGFKNWITDKKIALFAVDEAHCVSQWGHDFRAEYSELHTLKTLRPDVPILALTASATPTVLDDIAKNLKLNNPQRLVHGFYRPNLYYQVETCSDEDQKIHWLIQAIKQFPTGRILIYCGTRKVTEQLSADLEKKFDHIGFYHAGIGIAERTKTQESYAKSELRILVATNAFGMGIDQPDVRLVIHYQMPANIDSLYQEMGRAGRDDAHSTCLMLYSKKDKGLQSYFIQTSVAIKAIKDLRYRNLDALVSYSEAGECRHAEILTYYKDSQRLKKCGHCDTCDPKSNRKIQTPQFTITKKATAKKKVFAFTDDTMLTRDEETRFKTLREWRKAKATELDLPAFVIFGDKTLRELAQKNPQSLAELTGIYGIGEQKMEKFGWNILAELKK